ncbi:MAG TPA: transglutaminase-like domain-containing protein [Solirubrobacteraceae bacterium]|nr:transglutaminase-like domain-containing protein [Solirubrobacteraceae bacterium]
MSSIPVVTPADLPAARAAGEAASRGWIRSLAFAGLCAYGVERWSRLMVHPAPWRLYGLAALAVAFAVLVPSVRRLAGAPRERHRLRGRLAGAPRERLRGRLARAPRGRHRLRGRLAGAVLAAALILAAFPVAGLPLGWVTGVRVAVSVREIGHGLEALGAVLVPYLGRALPIRLVMNLGAAVLLFDAAAALAFAGRGDGGLGDGRRAAAALPLVALAVVPCTLVPVAAPALQGLVLFGLLAAFVWGERIATGRRGAAVGMACLAGLLGMIALPTLSASRPWIDYEAWGAASGGPGLESFNWNQTYGPLSWPQDGHVMFTVRARTGDYWKAEDLNAFDGRAWVAGVPIALSPQGGLLTESSASGSASASPEGDARTLPPPSPAAVRRYTHTDQVTIGSLATTDVIAGSGITERPQIAGGVAEGSVPGTWTAFHPLGPGDTYSVTTYSPTPSAEQLQQASEGVYPWSALAPELTLVIPARGGSTTGVPFPGFHEPLGRIRQELVRASPYAPAVRLAQRLAGDAATPYDFIRAVQRYLDSGRYIYDQRPQSARYPLLDFLFHSRIGYCQQFSGAMAMLLRMGGLPARVAAGFTPGSFDARHHIWTVSDTDAHAWVEVWFPTYGWVRFDPTPATAPALRNSALRDEPRPGAISRAFGEGHFSPFHTQRQTSTHERSHTAHAAAAPGGGAHGGSGGGGWGWAAGGIAVTLLLGSALWMRARRGPLDRLGELERALARTGRPLPSGATLASLERRFHGSPDAVAYIRALRLERYGHPAGPPTASGRRAVRAELAAGLGIAGRLRALWALPPRP